jgi:hypothetical protein
MFTKIDVDNRFRSAAALIAGASSLLCLLFCFYLGCKHWHIVNAYAITLIFIPFAINTLAQYLRVRRKFSAVDVESFNRKEVIEAFFDLLFFASLSNWLLLIYIAALLRHIDGFV